MAPQLETQSSASTTVATSAGVMVEVRNLVKSYHHKTVVNNVSFAIGQGEVFGILGPNGAGKTTTLEMIEGMREITSGTVILDNINTQENPYAVKERIGIQLQASAFFPNLSLVELLQMFSDLYGQTNDPVQ